MKFAPAPLFLCLSIAAAHADPGPYDLYASGKYDEAMRAGEAENNGASLVVAARAALTDASLRDPPCLTCLERAEDYARRAAAADPALPDAHTDIAIALGLEARITGPFLARLHNIPGRMERELDAALAEDPNNAPALAALGTWNIEIVRVGGSVLAKLLYGATVENGFALFARAFAAAPGDLAIRYQYALTLAGYDPDDYRLQIETTLASVGQIPPVTAFDAVLRARAGALLFLLRQDDHAAFRAHVRKYQGYP